MTREGDTFFNYTFHCLILLHLLFATGVHCTKCYKNDELGDREGNVYMCDGEDKTECCEENGEFTCCEPHSITTLKEQLTLWGCVLTVVLVISVLMCYFWKDITCCNEETPLSKRCCKKSHDDDDDEKLTPIPEPSFSPRTSVSSQDDFRSPSQYYPPISHEKGESGRPSRYSNRH